VQFFFFNIVVLGFNWTDMWGHVHLTINLYFCHLSADKWVPQVRFAVNWLQIYKLSELQSTCEKVVDFGCQNVK
jgi:hypothetical protein